MLTLIISLALGSLQPADQSSQPSRDIHTYIDVRELDPSALEEAVSKLNGLGIVTDPQYWLDNARTGKTVPSSSMAEILILAANKFETVSSIEEALEVLQRQKILSDMERWKHQFLDRSNLSGADAFFLLYVLAEKIN